MRKTLAAIALAAGLAVAGASAHEADSSGPKDGGMMLGGMMDGGMMGLMSEMRDMMATCNEMMSAMMDEHGSDEAPAEPETHN
jgi:Spy/CpxP family protein refolding chaperone